LDPEPPAEVEAGDNRLGGVPGSIGDGVQGSRLIDTIIREGTPPPPIPRVEPPHVTPPAAAAPKRIRVSSGVQMARLTHRVEPVYPALAKSARISGTVQLEGVIGTDGRLRALRVLSGHPFLAKAAIDAVSQWIYEPTLLSGEPVEVVAPITVNFILN